jgi:hypothetical protein
MKKRQWHPDLRIAAMAIVCPVALAGWRGAVAGDTRSDRLLDLAREALGGTEAVAGVHTLTARGRFRRVLADIDMDGEFVLAVQPPDKVMRTETVRLMGRSVTRRLGVNGDRLLHSTDARAEGSRADPFPVPRGAPRVASDAELEQGLVRLQRKALARLLLVWLATPPPDGRFELTYAGLAEAPEGAAEVVEARGADGFRARLFLDARTHRPLLLAYPDVRLPGRRPSGGFSVAPPPLEEFRLFVDDHRPVGPLVLPHHASVSVGSETTEEWDIDEFRINPPIDADTFEPQP